MKRKLAGLPNFTYYNLHDNTAKAFRRMMFSGNADVAVTNRRMGTPNGELLKLLKQSHQAETTQKLEEEIELYKQSVEKLKVQYNKATNVHDAVTEKYNKLYKKRTELRT